MLVSNGCQRKTPLPELNLQIFPATKELVYTEAVRGCNCNSVDFWAMKKRDLLRLLGWVGRLRIGGLRVRCVHIRRVYIRRVQLLC